MGTNFFARDLRGVSILLMFDTLSSHPQKITESREEKVKSNQKLRKEKVEILLTKDRLQAD